MRVRIVRMVGDLVEVRASYRGRVADVLANSVATALDVAAYQLRRAIWGPRA